MKQSNAVAIIGDGRPRMPTVERNSSILGRIVRDTGSGSFNVEPVNEYTPLATREDVDAMRGELGTALVPAEDKHIKAAVAMLVGAYRKSDLENPDIFVRSLVADLSDYPPDILSEMVVDIRRGLKYFPTIAECVASCERLIAKRRAEAKAVEQMELEHERRKLAAEEAERRRAEDDARRAAVCARLAGTYGARLALDAFELERAERGAVRALDYAERRNLDKALDAGEPWALATIWCLYVAASLLYAGKDCGWLTPRQVIDAIELMPAGFRTAREFMQMAFSGEVKKGVHKPGSDKLDAYADDKSLAWWKIDGAMREMTARIRERYEAPSPRGQWLLFILWAKSQGMDHDAVAEFYEHAVAGDAERSALISKLEADEAARVADMIASNRKGMAELFDNTTTDEGASAP